MMQLGNKHSRHSIKRRTTLFMNGSQHNQRIKTLYHYLRATMSQAVHGGQYNPETMEQRNTATKFIICRKLHVLTGQETIVSYIIMCKHDSLWESCRAGSVLHIHRVVAVHLFLGFSEFVILYITSQ